MLLGSYIELLVVKSDSDGSHGITAEDVGARIGESEAEAQERRLEQKRKQKVAFDSSYDNTNEDEEVDYYAAVKQDMAEQQERNLAEFADQDDAHRFRLEGGTNLLEELVLLVLSLGYHLARAGCYVRIELDDVPCEFVQHFDVRYPAVLGGVLPGEDNLGLVQVAFRYCPCMRRLTIGPIGSHEKASLVLAYPEERRSSHHLPWLASFPDDAASLLPRCKWKTAYAEVHSRTFALLGHISRSCCSCELWHNRFSVHLRYQGEAFSP
jgi:hypothetical protein